MILFSETGAPFKSKVYSSPKCEICRTITQSHVAYFKKYVTVSGSVTNFTEEGKLR